MAQLARLPHLGEGRRGLDKLSREPKNVHRLGARSSSERKRRVAAAAVLAIAYRLGIFDELADLDHATRALSELGARTL